MPNFGCDTSIFYVYLQKEDSEYWSSKRNNVVPKDDITQANKRGSEYSGENSKSEGDTGGATTTDMERTSVTQSKTPIEDVVQEDDTMGSKPKKGHSKYVPTKVYIHVIESQ